MTKQERVEGCAKAIAKDQRLIDLLLRTDVDCRVEDLAAGAAGLLFILPLKAAKAIYETRRTMERAIEKFSGAIDTYQRQSGDFLPDPSTIVYRRLDDDVSERAVRQLPTVDIPEYLEELGNHLRDADGGTWVHPRIATSKGQWPRTESSAAEVWIIRALGYAGFPVSTKEQQDRFLMIALRLIEQVSEWAPNPLETTRKSLQNHPAFSELQKSRQNFHI